MQKVKFHGVECDVVFDQYHNGRTAIRLTEGGMPYAMATLNDPDAWLESDQVIIKDYSENEGMVKALQEAGIIQPLFPHELGSFYHNKPSAWVCNLLVKEVK